MSCAPTSSEPETGRDRACIALRHGGGIALQAVAVAEQGKADLIAPVAQVAGGDKAVAAVVAGSTEDGDASTRRRHQRRLIGHRAPGVLHEGQAGDAGRHRQAVGARHLRVGQELEPGHPFPQS